MALTPTQKRQIFGVYLDSRPADEPTLESLLVLHDFMIDSTKAQQVAQALNLVTDKRDTVQAQHDAIDAEAAARKTTALALIADLNAIITELGGTP